MTTIKKKYQGLHAYRYAREPLELKFAQAWQHCNRQGDTLEWLLGDGATKVDPSDRDHLVACTVIQWLGSPCGQSFLDSVIQEDHHEPKG